MKNWKVISILVSDFMTMFAILIGRIEIAFGIALVSIALAALITIFDKEFTAKNQDFKSFLLAMGGYSVLVGLLTIYYGLYAAFFLTLILPLVSLTRLALGRFLWSVKKYGAF